MTSWLDSVKTFDCGYYTQENNFICEDCRIPGFPKTDGVFLDNVETDQPAHCSRGERCKNAVTLPDGRKIGILLTFQLSEKGLAYTRQKVCENVIYGSQTQKLVSRLWLHFLLLRLEDFPMLQISSTRVLAPIASLWREATVKVGVILPQAFTDLMFVYSVGRFGDHGSILRGTINDLGNLNQPSLVDLPVSETIETPLTPMILEAVSENAWGD